MQVNTIRVYNLDPDLDHNDCASIFNAAGIYMILDVNSPLPDQSLDRGAPGSSYSSDYMKRVFAVVEAFKNFPNTLGFFSGNEVINEQSVPQVPNYIRAVTRDLKDYISKQVNRAIPVGYSAADVRDILGDTWAYLSCNVPDSPTSKIDFFGLNSYSWCGDSSFTTSGYNILIAQFSNTTIPVFFSEYGCNKVTPRTFTEVPVLYGDQMTPVMSGGLIYEYSQEVSNYGLVSLNDNSTLSLLPDYASLQAQYQKLNISLLGSGNATAAALTPATCTAALITDSSFSSNFSVPTRAAGVDALIASGIPNANQGKVVDVSKVDVTETVYDTHGSQITGLKLNKLPNDQSNTPGSNDSGSTSSSSNTATSASPSATATHKGAAARTGDHHLGRLVFSVLALGLVLPFS